MSWRAQLSRTLQEIRIHYCQTSPSSHGAREFVQRNYKDLKMLNPKLPILIRECSDIQPRIYARYDFGVERTVGLDNLGEAEITKKLEELAKNVPKKTS